MKIREVSVVGQRLIEFPIFKISVSDLEFSLNRVVAVGVVVDDRLEGLNREGIVDRDHPKPARFELVNSFAEEFVSRRYVVKFRRFGRAGHDDDQDCGGENNKTIVHGDPECEASYRMLSIRVNLLRFFAH